MSQAIPVTDKNFDQEVLQSDQPVLVDYWAEWCGPCKSVGPIVDATADTYADRLKVTKLDVDANGETAQRFGIRSIPTLMLFKGGKIVASHTGAVTQGQMDSFLQDHV